MTDSTASPRRRPFGGLTIGGVLLEARAFLALIVIFAIFSFLAPSSYPTLSNIITMSQQVSVYALLSIGLLMVILTGGIDLSVGSTLGLAGMVSGLAIKGVTIFGVTYYPKVWVVVIIAIATGAAVGLVNGILVAKLHVAPFVATLGMLYVARGLAELSTNGLTVNDLSGKHHLGNTGFDWLGFNSILGIPVGVWVLVVIAIVASLLLNRSVFGRWLYATGGNQRAAELSGVPIRSVTIRAYTISGMCAAIAGVILTSELTSAGPTQGNTYELTAIAAVVIGGAALSGGRGHIRGTLLGSFVIGFLAAGLDIVGVSSYVQTVFTGAVIVLAVLLNSVQYGGPRRRSKPRKEDPPPSRSPDASSPDTKPAPAMEHETG